MPQVEKFQSELDRLSATLKQIEGYNEAMKGEIAVTRRAAYAAEEAASKQERAKMTQDFRCEENAPMTGTSKVVFLPSGNTVYISRASGLLDVCAVANCNMSYERQGLFLSTRSM